jgi:hypothetical protein
MQKASYSAPSMYQTPQLTRPLHQPEAHLPACADIFGSGFGRDIEPSREDGARLYNIMASCIRVFRSSPKGCTAATAKEVCCYGELSDELPERQLPKGQF